MSMLASSSERRLQNPSQPGRKLGSDFEPPDRLPEPAISRARRQLIERLCEVVVWPATRISVHERDLAADLLISLLPSCDQPARIRLAQRLALLSEASKALQRYLCMDNLDVAAPLLSAGLGMDDADLVDCLSPDRIGHALAVAGRRRWCSASRS